MSRPNNLQNDSDEPGFFEKLADRVIDSANDIIEDMAGPQLAEVLKLPNQLCDWCGSRKPVYEWPCCHMASDVCGKCQIIHKSKHTCERKDPDIIRRVSYIQEQNANIFGTLKKTNDQLATVLNDKEAELNRNREVFGSLLDIKHDEIDDLNKTIEDLNIHNTTLMAEVDRLSKKNDELFDELTSLAEAKNAIELQLVEAHAQLENLKSDSQKEMDVLLEQLKSYRSANKSTIKKAPIKAKINTGLKK